MPKLKRSNRDHAHQHQYPDWTTKSLQRLASVVDSYAICPTSVLPAAWHEKRILNLSLMLAAVLTIVAGTSVQGS